MAAVVGAAPLVVAIGLDSVTGQQARQFCAEADAGRIASAINGATVQCQFNPESNRHQWVAIAQATTTTLPPTIPSTTA
ncbi:MAG: hypothetical protein LC808_40685, partial [Actinobacteria bacterium]|nr:hypothetical protein [Actinomycetota bacterium]